VGNAQQTMNMANICLALGPQQMLNITL